MNEEERSTFPEHVGQIIAEVLQDAGVCATWYSSLKLGDRIYEELKGEGLLIPDVPGWDEPK